MISKKFDYNSVASGHYEKIIWEAHPIRKFWHQQRFLEMQNLINSTADSTLLDYGCASGSFLGNFDKPYAQAIGVDIAKPQVDLANQKYGNSKLSFITVEQLATYKENSLDYIISSEVIEHIPAAESENMLLRFRNLLKPKGKLILSTPNYFSLWPAIEFFVNRLSEVDYDHQHVHKLDSKKCLKLLEKCEFKIETYQTIFIVSPFLAGISWGLAHRMSAIEKRFLPHAGSLILLSALKK